MLADVPDNESAAAVAISVNAAGGAVTKTTVLLTPDEVDAAAQKSVGYRPPGSSRSTPSGSRPSCSSFSRWEASDSPAK